MACISSNKQCGIVKLWECAHFDLDAQVLLQKYFDRWQIEYNHRDEKDILGVGEAQVWAALSTPRVPAFKVAAYSQMLVSALLLYGPRRTADYPLAKPCKTSLVPGTDRM